MFNLRVLSGFCGLALACVPSLAGAALPEGYEQLEAVSFDMSAQVDTGVAIDGDQIT